MIMNEFIKDMFKRTVYTGCECFLGIIGGMSMISQIDWKLVASSVAFACLVTIVRCVMMETRPEE